MDQQEAVFGVLNIFNNSITFQRIQRSSEYIPQLLNNVARVVDHIPEFLLKI